MKNKIRCTPGKKMKPKDVLKLMNPDNENTHSPDQLRVLKKLVNKLGQRKNIIISNQSGFIVTGHATIQIIHESKWDYCAVDYQDYSSPTEEMEHRVADNEIAHYSELDEQKLYDNMEELEIDSESVDLEDYGIILDSDDGDNGSPLDNKVPEIQKKVITRPGDIWMMGDHRLMCGDSTDSTKINELMCGRKADMVFTDPPYGVGYSGGIQFTGKGVKKNQRDKLSNDETTDIYTLSVPMMARYCNGPIYTWYADSKGKDLYNAISECGDYHAMIVWVKNGGYGALNAAYKQKHEPCVFWKPFGKKLNFVGPTTENTIWEIKKDGTNKLHPTQKPVALAERAIRNHSGKLVLDLFLGSGSTLIACEKAKRKCYGMELEGQYCDVIIRRWQNFTDGQAILKSNNKTFKQMGKSRRK
jgi:DNA modification methylase